jgi:hypothetical protein
MKIIYEFDDERDEGSIQNHKYADESMSALQEMGKYLRHLSKYVEADTVEIEDVYEEFFDIINNNDLSRDIIGF